MKKTILIIALFFSFQLIAQTNVSGGIFSNTIWQQSNSPYIVTGNVVVFPGMTLTIEPGVMVRFDDGTNIEIRQSKLIALGTAANQIVFTSNNLNPIKGSWDKIYLNQSLDVRIKHCDFKFASEAINGNSDSLSIIKSNFTENILGIGGSGNYSFNVDSCSFRNNNTGQNVPGNYWSMKNCIYNKNQIGLIAGNGVSIIKCTLDSNSVVGLYKNMGCNDTIRDSEIKYNETGIASTPGHGGCSNDIIIFNNHIEYNNIGILIQDIVGPQQFFIYQNCICSNATYNFQNQNAFNINISNNCWCSNNMTYIQSSIEDAFDNINYGIVSYTPIDTTLCPIDATIGVSENEISSYLIYPNPTNSNFTIKSNFTNEQTVELFDLNGKLLLSKKINGKEFVDITDIHTGVYVLILKQNDRVITEKLVITK